MERKEFESYLARLQELKIYHYDYATDGYKVLDEISEKHNKFFTPVATGLDVDKHRWYEIATDVHKLGQWYVGMRYVSDHFSESQSFEDVGIFAEFFEMERVTKPTYIPK